jgi:hypothetical protein
MTPKDKTPRERGIEAGTIVCWLLGLALALAIVFGKG